MSQQLSSLIGEIYDTALDRALWPVALRSIARFVGGFSASIVWKDVTRQSAELAFQDGGISDDYVRLYLEEYVHLDPSTVGQYLAPVGEPASTVDFVPYAEFQGSRFYREWAMPQGLVDFASVVLDRAGSTVALLGVFRCTEQGLVDDEMRRQMRLVVPHIQRATRLGRWVGERIGGEADLAAALDGLSAAVLLIDPRGQMVRANRAGEDLLARGAPLRLIGGRVTAAESDADAALHAWLAAARSPEHRGEAARALPLAGPGDDRHVGHLLPLRRSDAAGPSAATAALFVLPSSAEPLPAAEATAEHYHLTPAELRTLLAILEGSGVAGAAAALGLSEATVKTHLQHLFEKTGTRRQADLVRLVADFRSPLRRETFTQT